MCNRCAELEAENAELRQKLLMSDGRRGEYGVVRAEGFTTTETAILRVFASRPSGYFNTDDPARYRHMSNIRRKLRPVPSIVIETRVNAGFQLVSGRDDLMELLRGASRAEIAANKRAAPKAA